MAVAQGTALKRYRVARPRVADEFIGSEVVVINFDSGTYHGIRGSGVVVWQLLDAGWSIGELLDELARRHTGVNAAAQAVVIQMIAELEAQQLIVPCSDASAAALTATEEQPSPFVPPELDTRDDLRDFLLLDPVHDVDEQGWPHAARQP